MKGKGGNLGISGVCFFYEVFDGGVFLKKTVDSAIVKTSSPVLLNRVEVAEENL